MIKNERQYRITKARAREFAEAATALEASPIEEGGVHPLILKARRDAARSQYEELQEQLSEYEALVAGEKPVLELDSLAELPRALIQARIAAGLSQSDMAERLGLKPQQIQRYEATDYSAASLERIQEVARALGVSIREEVLIPNERFTLRELWSTLQGLGFSKDLVTQRLIPGWLRDQVERIRRVGTAPLDEAVVASSVVGYVARTFGLTASALLGPRLPALNLAAVHTGRFKTTYAAQEERLSAYAVYAHVLSLLTLEATKHLDQKPVPEDPYVARAQIIERHGQVTFETVLEYVWDLGIPVLPLRDPAAFHGACWRVGGRNVIVLKQLTPLRSRWLYDLLHELCHAAEDPERDEMAVIEVSPISPDRQEGPDEERANDYAETVIFGDDADDLAQLCVKRAGGNLRRLKRAVVEVAERERVNLGALANYLAYRLAMENGEDWWGTAQNLQHGEASPWLFARDMFLTRVNFSSLNEFDRSLLLRALEDEQQSEE